MGSTIDQSTSGERQSAGGAFLAGVLTTVVVLVLVGAFVGHRVGFSRLASRIRDTVLAATGPKTARLLDLPADVREELTRLRGVISNAGNPIETGARRHDTILVRPDARFGWVLRPGAEVSATVLRARNPLNLDPPVLFLPAGAQVPPLVERYLQEQGRLNYRYSIDARGHRRTLPQVESERALLVVGDSVAFGSGVDDDATVASFLQGLLGERMRVVNAGVAGYTGQQVLEVARALAAEREFEGLVYLSSQNDFMEDPGRAYPEVAETVLADMGRLRDHFAGRTVALFVPYLQFSVHDLLRGEGWPAHEIRRSAQLYRALPEIAARHGFAYVDWPALLQEATHTSGSIFERLALFVDHGHLSPRGSRRAAEAIHEALQDVPREPL